MDFVTWWTTLLLQTTKASLGIKEATHMDALEDAPASVVTDAAGLCLST
jgi:hypothetical protein